MQTEWFTEWFDSPWYHQLYRHRDEAQAKDIIDNLMAYLNLPPGARVLDLACGRGRHAYHLSQMGYEVTGLDISPQSIDFARRMEHEGLSFFQHDMRHPFRIRYYDLVCNFFTSFGYFRKDAEHLQTLRHIESALLPDGRFVLDFLNAVRCRRELVPFEEVEMDGVHFAIRRQADEHWITKSIAVDTPQGTRHFEEKVRAFTQDELVRMLETVGLQVEDAFGNYELAPFTPGESDRLILIARKGSKLQV